LQLHFNNIGTIELQQCEHSQLKAYAFVKYDNLTHKKDATCEPSTDINNQKICLAFLIAAKIANEILELDCDVKKFRTPQGGHMVCYGDYNSWGTDAEANKKRVKDNLNDQTGFEFYLRHALIALKHSHEGVQLVQNHTKQMVCGF